ncbi:probable S-adenosylmethionine-dependent methyltransferase at5g38780 [Phtheirospermum japonicum]|uniref:Probable S-adenosylmethionine-dependent methyltransferase at5g38780 n=1 Tax=Phtheirospermum japonicum TaxID=374723 RepID=A0A830D525_9LAMI|nr:probable S-adenosylmethionine-dependent methyltransferase at5g38780 [Phtheirospermum japonicum]
MTKAMNAGDGPDSYIRNSSYQGGLIELIKPIIEEEIAEKLDLVSTNLNGPICIADFGCSTGGNSFPAMQFITHAIKKKLESSSSSSSSPEFYVYFNDVVTNDFNTLFGSLGPERVYNAVGVPGDFHGRLLPRSSLHFAYSAWSLHWLTEVPRAVADPDSPAWNGGRVFYRKERKEVCDAYWDQYSRELGAFLEARAVEMVAGGLMAFSNLGMPESWNPETEYTILTYHDILESCLLDMARKGTVSEAKLDTFNFPFYYTTPRQLEAILKSNRSFTIERMEILNNNPGKHTLLDARARAAATKAVSGRLLTAHFGSQTITDELFELYAKKLAATPVFNSTDNDKTMVILVVLKRKYDY